MPHLSGYGIDDEMMLNWDIDSLTRHAMSQNPEVKKIEKEIRAQIAEGVSEVMRKVQGNSMPRFNRGSGELRRRYD